eukprot:3783883-Amphidinium_carterae.1
MSTNDYPLAKCLACILPKHCASTRTLGEASDDKTVMTRLRAPPGTKTTKPATLSTRRAAEQADHCPRRILVAARAAATMGHGLSVQLFPKMSNTTVI